MRGPPSRRGVSSGIFVWEGTVQELSISADETGGQGGHCRYYAVTLVIHDQKDSLIETIRRYEASLTQRGLPDIPLHAGPLLTGHDEYESMPISQRKALLVSFFILLQHMPLRYHTFLYKRAEHPDPQALSARMRRDLVIFLFDNLDYFQRFDTIKVYYDDAQRIVSEALHNAVDYAISRNVVLYRRSRPEDYRLSQAADLICTLELTATKYAAGQQTATDEKFFGSAGAFRRNYLKALKRKRLDS